MYRLLCDPALYTFEHAAPDSEAALRQRFERLASRRSPDGLQHWLNWVLRQRSDGALIGFVQATVREDGRALVAYVLGSGHWGHGLATEAVQAMLVELNSVWQVPQALAVFKRANQRSRALLQRLGFAEPGAAEAEALALEADEDVLVLRWPA